MSRLCNKCCYQTAASQPVCSSGRPCPGSGSGSGSASWLADHTDRVFGYMPAHPLPNAREAVPARPPPPCLCIGGGVEVDVGGCGLASPAVLSRISLHHSGGRTGVFHQQIISGRAGAARSAACFCAWRRRAQTPSDVVDFFENCSWGCRCALVARCSKERNVENVKEERSRLRHPAALCHRLLRPPLV